MEGVHDDDAALHYEFDVAEDGDIREGIALNGEEVGELAVLDGADGKGAAVLRQYKEERGRA